MTEFTAPAFSLTSSTFHLRTVEELQLPEYKGSALRGGFGHVMKKVSCVLPRGQCEARCQLGNQCAYGYVFETQNLQNQTERAIEATNLPHPFVILPPRDKQELIPPGENLSFQLTLIGKGIDFLTYFIYAFDELGRTGLGRGRGRYRLLAVTDNFNQNTPIYHADSQTLNGDFQNRQFSHFVDAAAAFNPERIVLNFLTPTGVLDRGKIALNLPFDLLMRGLLRRASWLAQIHCQSPWQLDYAAFLAAARTQVQLESSTLRPFSWERYSQRQQQRMRFDSFIGAVTYTGNLAPFLPFILLGQYIHLGSKTTFGMGKYVVT